MIAGLLRLPHTPRCGEDQRFPRAALLVSICLLATETAVAQTRTSLYSEAQQQLRARDFEDGCRNAQAVTEEDPENFGAFNLLGVCAVRRGDGTSAIAYFRKSLRFNPRYADARINLAMQLRDRGQKQAALAQLREVLNFDPQNVVALYQIGKTEIETGAPQKAAGHLLRAHELAPDNPAYVLALADVQATLGQRSEALGLLSQVTAQNLSADDSLRATVLALNLEDNEIARREIERAIAEDPNSLQKILAISTHLSQEGDYKTVRALLSQLPQFAGTSAEWNASLGYAEYKLGDPSAAAIHLRKAIELSPRNADYYMKVGQLLLFYNSDQAAAEFFMSGLKDMPNSADLYFGLAVCYWAHQLNTELAIRYLNKALEIDAGFQSALELLAVIYQYEKQWQSLETVADRLVRLNPKLSRGYYFKADAQLALGVDERSVVLAKAQHLLTQAIRLEPHSSYAHDDIGKIFLERGDFPRAITEFKIAIDSAPEASESYYHLATAYRKAGQIEESKQVLEKFKEAKAHQSEQERQEGLFQVAR